MTTVSTYSRNFMGPTLGAANGVAAESVGRRAPPWPRRSRQPRLDEGRFLELRVARSDHQRPPAHDAHDRRPARRRLPAAEYGSDAPKIHGERLLLHRAEMVAGLAGLEPEPRSGSPPRALVRPKTAAGEIGPEVQGPGGQGSERPRLRVRPVAPNPASGAAV